MALVKKRTELDLTEGGKTFMNNPPLEGIDALWSESRGDPKIRIAILDGPVDSSHPAFRGASLELLELLVPSMATPGPASEHGTHVASVILGQPESPVVGVAPRCTGLVLPVFADGPDGEVTPCSQFDLARAIRHAVAAGAHMITISAGQKAPTASAALELLAALEFCEDNNVLVVAAAGNDGCDCVQLPAAVKTVLAVGALNSHGEPLGCSNWGSTYRENGIVAPGQAILGAVPGGRVTTKSGTSFATALVAGVTALLLHVQRQTAGRSDAASLRHALVQTARPCRGDNDRCKHFLAGHLDITASLRRISRQVEVGPQSGKSLLSGSSGNEGSFPTAAVAYKKSSSGKYQEKIGENYMQSTAGETGLELGAMQESSPPAPSANHDVPGPMGATPSSCGCGGASGPCKCGQPTTPAMVYALGYLGCDYGTEARRDSLVQAGLARPEDSASVLEFLKEHPEFASAITWVLMQEATPIYAIQPAGAYASLGYERLRAFLQAQMSEGVERVSVPGYIAGKAELLNGQTVPVVIPELRGIFSWSKPALITAVHGNTNDSDAAESQARVDDITNFLDRVYYEIRNFGVSPQERAINYSATNAFQIARVFEAAISSSLKLDRIETERSPLCRPHSDCWDVKLCFFNPARRFEQARRVYRFTVDVRDVIPVTVGPVRQWDVYS